jgi:hypothetical protein
MSIYGAKKVKVFLKFWACNFVLFIQ